MPCWVYGRAPGVLMEADDNPWGQGRETPPGSRQLAPHLMCEAVVCASLSLQSVLGSGVLSPESFQEKDSEASVLATVPLCEPGCCHGPS